MKWHDEQVTLWAVEGQTLQELREVVQNLPQGYPTGGARELDLIHRPVHY